ncbi:hypothetical protein OB920_04330 [Halobacteria archaeon HArc-gm2]|nr:hypothetical protein [Halobacteria archaeon HArc-gm2]
MAAHISRGECGDAADLPAVVPFDIPHLSRLSWELGSRIVEDDESTRYGTWSHVETPWRLTVYRVTSATVLLRLHTPVGRERFYGAALRDFESDGSRLETDPTWRQVD